MKKIACFIAMALFTLNGCSSVELNSTKTAAPDDDKTESTTVLSCTDYTLGADWSWTETPANQLIVIRSQAELAQYITPNDKLPEDIDFGKNMLLLVAGQASNGIESIGKTLEKIDARYLYSLTILLNDATEAPKWRVVQVVPAMPADAKIILDLEAK